MTSKLEEESGVMSPQVKTDMRNRLSEISAKIRGVSDVDYAVKRGEFAKELLIIDSKKALKQGHKKVGKNGRWLLSETVVKTLPRWLEALVENPNPEQACTELMKLVDLVGKFKKL